MSRVRQIARSMQREFDVSLSNTQTCDTRRLPWNSRGSLNRAWWPFYLSKELITSFHEKTRDAGSRALTLSPPQERETVPHVFSRRRVGGHWPYRDWSANVECTRMPGREEGKEYLVESWRRSRNAESACVRSRVGSRHAQRTHVRKPRVQNCATRRNCCHRFFF